MSPVADDRKAHWSFIADELLHLGIGRLDLRRVHETAIDLSPAEG